MCISKATRNQNSTKAVIQAGSQPPRNSRQRLPATESPVLYAREILIFNPQYFPRKMKKLFALTLMTPLLISCSGPTHRNSDSNIESFIKDTNSLDILMGQFDHNIENIWGFNEVLIAGPKDYVKYTDRYQTRSHINFESGTLTVETIAETDAAAHLRQTIISTLLMGDDPGSIDLYSDANDIQISKEPFLYGQVVDNTGEPIRWEWRATKFADWLIQNRMKTRTSGIHIIHSISPSIWCQIISISVHTNTSA